MDEVAAMTEIRKYLMAFAGAAYQNPQIDLPAAPDAAAPQYQKIDRSHVTIGVCPIFRCIGQTLRLCPDPASYRRRLYSTRRMLII